MRKELEASLEKYASEFPDLTFNDRGAYMDGFNDGWDSRERLKQEASTIGGIDMETARVTARQVAESMSVEELRAAAKELPEHSEVKFVAEDIAQLLEYIADLRDEADNE